MGLIPLFFFSSLCQFYNVQQSFGLLSKEKLLPNILRSSKNPTCDSQASDLFNSFINGDEWAWEMVDASSKLPSGIYMGNSRDMGNFDECLRLNNVGETNIKGKYCFAGITTVLPKAMNISGFLNDTSVFSELNILNPTLLSMITDLHQEWGVSEFMREQKVIDKLILKNLGNSAFTNNRLSLNGSESDQIVITTLSLCLPDACLPSDLDLPSIFYAVDNLCVTKDSFNSFDIYDYLAISFFVLIFAVIIVSTIYDVKLSASKKDPLQTILTSFSIYTNGKDLTKTTKNPNHLLCLEGIKTLSTLWVILGHRFTIIAKTVAINFNDVRIAQEMMYTQYVQAAQYAVDTFMVLSGCLMAYLSLKSMSQLKQKFEGLNATQRSIKMISVSLVTYLHRYLRLTPAIAVLFIFTVTLVRHLGEGPLYYQLTDTLTKPCVNNWWSFFLYIENYVHPNEQCLPHLWYVDVDMHVFLLSPFILWPLVYYPKKMLRFGLPILIIISCVVVFIICYVKELEWRSDDYLKYFYFPTHTRLAPWFIGIGLGTVLHNHRNINFHINKIYNVLIWIAVLVALVLLAFGQQNPSYNYGRLKNAIWNTINKPLWSICICWIVWACVKGHGGIINSFLSCSLFQIGGKLTFCMYLVHLMVLIVNQGQLKVPIYFDDISVIRMFFADAVIVTFVAFVWTMAFEIPFRIIEKTLIGGFASKVTQPSNVAQKSTMNDEVFADLHVVTHNKTKL